MRREGGFTLVEVLVALVVTVAGLTLIAQGFTTGARASSASQNATRAPLIAQQVVTDYETGELALGQSNRKTYDKDTEFTTDARCEAYETGVTLLTVTVIWVERGQERTYVLTRLMRERPTEP